MLEVRPHCRLGETLDQLHVDMTNCYGIGSLKHVFDFTKGNTSLVYAPNGVMKTSFLRVFENHRDGVRPVDRIYVDRDSDYSLKTDGNALEPERVLAVGSPTDQMAKDASSRLMVNEALREEYQRLLQALDDASREIASRVARSSGAGRDAITPMVAAFGRTTADFPELLASLRERVREGDDPGLGFVQTRVVFNDKVRAFVNQNAAELADYMSRYNELVDGSAYFRPGGFNHYHASTVRKSLEGAKFFEANHTVRLSGADPKGTEVSSADELDSLIEEEKKRILADPSLLKRFEVIGKKLDANEQLRDFREFLADHPECVAMLNDLERFEQEVWVSHLFGLHAELSAFVVLYDKSISRMKEIVSAAREQETAWHEVVDEFHARFDVPYRLRVVNQHDVILRDDKPVLIFDWKDERGEEETLEDHKIHEVLSTGERRALYILNVIFEVRARQNAGEPTLAIFDDPADSFDYRNKYGIVEYLGDLAEDDRFRVVVLTHNFDFYRTVFSRLGIRYQDAFMVGREGGGILLQGAEYVKDPLGTWRNRLHKDPICLIASIPFARNLIEYQGRDKSDEYSLLTSVLHMKGGTETVTVNQVSEVIGRELNPPSAIPDVDGTMLDFIFEQASACTAGGDPTCLQKKVLLSIAIRLKAEQYMLALLDGSLDTSIVKSNQTRAIYNAYRTAFPGDPALRTMKKVMLMTPEAIHLNSFMYEPLLDMSDSQLCDLHAAVSGLV